MNETTQQPTPETCIKCEYCIRTHIRKDPPYITYGCDNEEADKYQTRVFAQTRKCKYFTLKTNDNE